MFSGGFDLPWWGYVIYTLVVTHVTIAAVTIFLHRHQAHRALDLHPIISHFFRFWLWLTTGMVTKEWASIHRKHHAKCETVEDPHSPQIVGIRKVLFEGAELYRKEAANAETLDALRSRYAGRLARTQGLYAPSRARRRAPVHHQLRPVRLHRHHDLGRADDLDSVPRQPASSTASAITGATAISSREMQAATSFHGAS